MPKEVSSLPDRIRGELADFLNFSAGDPDSTIEARLAESLALGHHLAEQKRH